MDSPVAAPVLHGPHVVLRPPEPRDEAVARRLGRDPAIFRCFGEPTSAPWRELTADEAEAFMASLRPADGEVRWVIEADGGFIGDARLHSFAPAGRAAAFAVGILSAAHLGRGLGTEVTRLVLDHAFATIGLHDVTVRVLAFNQRAIACYSACGFELDHREPRSVEIDGEWHDDLIMRVDEPGFRLSRAARAARAES
ncbi:MAG TPA: GNAT family protein [Thermoleophilia bacterium]|nr:GNAT family protein [Thermoleophilia bacterium]